jgi:hypothetical protein
VTVREGYSSGTRVVQSLYMRRRFLQYRGCAVNFFTDDDEF